VSAEIKQVVNDASASLACNPLSADSAAAINGKIALFDRGNLQLYREGKERSERRRAGRPDCGQRCRQPARPTDFFMFIAWLSSNFWTFEP